MFGVPLAGLPMSELQALNRELGRLCRRPPPEALTVCRIHARLVRSI
ncbi:N-acetylmannosamine-6-phosphate 2-epimerase [Synechococcus sp. RS9916]|nr:N-acetylmannosamine-6-phosphate 2-epimerase [Synechococcus sp. RS9916]